MDAISRGFREIFFSVDIKCLKIILFIENLLGIHRCVGFCGPVGKTIVYLLALVDCVLLFFCILRVVICSVLPLHLFLSASVHTIVPILCSLILCNRFAELIKILRKYNRIYGDDKIYVKKLKKFNIISLIFIVTVFMRRIFSVVINHYGQFSSSSSTVKFDGQPLNMVIEIYLIVMSNRYIIEYWVIYNIIKVISELLGCVVRSIETESAKKFNNNIDLLNKLEEWGVFFQNIVKCTDNFSAIFGFQIIVILASSLFYYVIFINLFATRNVLNTISGNVVWLFQLYTIVYIVFCLGILLSFAQSIQNNVQRLRQALARLANIHISDGAVYKSSKDLLHLVATTGVHVRAPGIQLDMALFPACIMLSTSYTIIYLQFNNVL